MGGHTKHWRHTWTCNKASSQLEKLLESGQKGVRANYVWSRHSTGQRRDTRVQVSLGRGIPFGRTPPKNGTAVELEAPNGVNNKLLEVLDIMMS